MNVLAPEIARHMLDELPGGVVRVQREHVTYVNRTFADIVGRTPEEMVGLGILELVAPEDARRMLDRYWARQEGERAPVSYEIAVLRRDGSRARVEIQPRVIGEWDSVVLVRDLSGALHDRELLSALADLSARLQRSRGAEGLLLAALEGLQDLGFAASYARLEGDEIVFGESRGRSPEAQRVLDRLPRSLPGMRVPLAAVPRTAEVLRLGRAVYDDDLLASVAAFARALGVDARDEGDRSVTLRGVTSPLVVRERPWGTLNVSSTTLDPEDAAALGLFATQLSSSLEVALTIEELESRNSELRAIHALAEAGSETELELVLPRLLSIAAASTRSERCAIFLTDDSRRELQLVGSHAFPAGVAGRLRRLRLDAPGDALLAPDHGRSFAASDLPEPRRGELVAAGFGENLLLPLQIKGRQSGTLWLSRAAGRPYPPDEVRAAELLARQVAIQVESARLYSETTRRVRSLSLLFETARAAAETEGVAALLERVLDLLAGTFSLDAAAVHLTSHGGLVLAAMRGPATADLPEVVESGLPVATGRHAQATMKIVARDHLVGTLTVLRPAEQPWIEEERLLLQSCAAQLGVAIEHARLFDELARTQEALVQRERLAALGELAALVAHEVRNPLGVIFNSLGSLRRILHLEGDARMLLDIVGEEADRLNRIVNDLLDFARPREPELRLEPMPPVIEDALVAAIPADAGVRVRRDVPADLPPIRADVRMIRQALLNLMINAVQAMPRGGTLGVEARVEDEHLLLSVTDSGPGIAPEFAARIFEPFFTTKAAGSGLGLAVVRRIAEAHHGEIRAGAGPEGGARFTLRLPLEVTA